MAWFMRMWRVQVALWLCYWRAWDRGDRYTYEYCGDRSIFVSIFWILMLFVPFLIAGILWGP
ncbi:hypothetical protein [Anaerospora hongkongensis]|uniref:hypothetical protein n=1 Tax=Anaerospora hongkongensis TaxID=244830 RepID=UPI002FDB8B4B